MLLNIMRTSIHNINESLVSCITKPNTNNMIINADLPSVSLPRSVGWPSLQPRYFARVLNSPPPPSKGPNQRLKSGDKSETQARGQYQRLK